MSFTETGIKLSPAPAVAPRSRAGTSGPRSFQPELKKFKTSDRVVLTGIDWVHGETGDHNETIISRYMDGTREDHIRFVFDVSAGNGVVCEPRFWKTEILEHMNGIAIGQSVRSPKFTIHQAIAEILGSREHWPRGEIETTWSVSSNLLTDLIRSGQLISRNGSRLERPYLEKFLLNRWTGHRE